MNTRFEQHVKTLPQIFRSYYEVSKAKQSPVDVGGLREEFVNRVLRFHLPSEYDVCAGEIIDADDRISKQQDLVIYHRGFPKLSVGESSSLMFVEGVNATIEVKSNLTYEKFKQALRNVASVKSLVPRIQLLAAGERAGYVMSFVFAYEGPTRPTLVDYYNRYMKEEGLTKESFFRAMPDALYVLEGDLFYKNDGWAWAKKSDEIVTTTDPPNAFSKFFFHILFAVTRGDIYAVDWRAYITT